MQEFGKRLLGSLSVGKKLNIFFGILAAISLLVVILNGVNSYQVNQEINRTSLVRVPAALASAQAQYSLLTMIYDVHGYLTIGQLSYIADYYAAKRVFETNLADLEKLSSGSDSQELTNNLKILRNRFEGWSDLTEHMFMLYNNPRLNQPGLYLYNTQVPSLKELILSDIGRMIEYQLVSNVPIDENSSILTDMISFQGSFETLITNLQGFALTGDLRFRNEYYASLPKNTTAWANLQSKRASLSYLQTTLFDQLSGARSSLSVYPEQIISQVQGEHAYEDLYLFQYQSLPQANSMLDTLTQITSDEQSSLQIELEQGRQSLANSQVQSVIGIVLLIAFGIGMAASLRITIVGPVRNLTEAAEHISGGEQNAHVLVESRDEIGKLAETFNLMTDRLHHTILSLENQTQQLEAMKEVAEAASLAKSEFLANMGHELRTPLNGILGYAQILGRDEGLSTAQLTAVNTIQNSGEHLLMLINDLLDLSKIEARRMELHPTDFHLPNFLGTIVDMFQIGVQQKKDLTFTYEQISSLPVIVYADERRLRQVLINLIGNAIKFTDQGRVLFRVGLIDGGFSSADAPKESCSIQFDVIDTGIGIPTDKLDMIFMPFEQAGDPQRRAEGTGLGLAITKNLVGAMKGSLNVISEMGVGSTFRLQLELPIVWSDEKNFETGTASIAGQPMPSKVQDGDYGIKSAPIVPPPPDEIAILYDLAMKGELPNLRQWAEKFARRGDQYLPFAQEMLRLTQEYDEDAILALIERYRENSPD